MSEPESQAANKEEAVGFFFSRQPIVAGERRLIGWELAFGSLEGGLAPENIVHVARTHLKGLIAYQSELGTALAIANQDGEEARREERMKIWGYA